MRTPAAPIPHGLSYTAEWKNRLFYKIDLLFRAITNMFPFPGSGKEKTAPLLGILKRFIFSDPLI